MRAKEALDVCRWIQRQDVDRSEQSVLHALAHRMNAAGEAWPSLATLAADAKLSRRGLTKVLGRLERKRLLERTREFRANGSNAATRYRLLLDGWQGQLPLGNGGPYPRELGTPTSERDHSNEDLLLEDAGRAVDKPTRAGVEGLPARLRAVVERRLGDSSYA